MRKEVEAQIRNLFPEQSLMIVGYLNLEGVISYPFENDSPLVVNSNTPKILKVPF